MPYPNDGTSCSEVMSPGMRENLFNPTPKDQPCFGSVSPVSNVKSPGLPSSAGIGVKFGCSESSSAAFVALPLAAPELGLGTAAELPVDEDEGEDGVKVEELAGTPVASDAGAALPESAALFAAASPADDAPAAVPAG